MSRRLLLSFAVLTLVACTGRTSPFGVVPIDGGPTIDSGLPDGAVVIDSGVIDSGVIDAGGIGVCTLGDFVTGFRLPGDLRVRSYDGLAIIRERSPLVLETAEGWEVEVTLVEQVRLPNDLRAGSWVWLQYGMDQPMWVNAALAIREIAPNDGPGRPRLIVWSAGEDIDLQDEFGEFVEAEYVVEDCAANDTSCGLARTLSLRVSTGRTTDVLRAGTTLERDNLRAGNGISIIYERVLCTDTPAVWYEGFLAFD